MVMVMVTAVRVERPGGVQVGVLFRAAADFDVQMTVHLWYILVINPTRCTDFSNLFLE